MKILSEQVCDCQVVIIEEGNEEHAWLRIEQPGSLGRLWYKWTKNGFEYHGNSLSSKGSPLESAYRAMKGE